MWSTEGASQRQPHLALRSRQEEDGMGKVRADATRAEWKVLADLEDPVLRGLGYRSVWKLAPYENCSSGSESPEEGNMKRVKVPRQNPG